MSFYYAGERPENCPLGAKPIAYLFEPPIHRARAYGVRETESDRAFRERMFAAIAGLGPVPESKRKVEPTEAPPRHETIDYHFGP